MPEWSSWPSCDLRSQRSGPESDNLLDVLHRSACIKCLEDHCLALVTLRSTDPQAGGFASSAFGELCAQAVDNKSKVTTTAALFTETTISEYPAVLDVAMLWFSWPHGLSRWDGQTMRYLYSRRRAQHLANQKPPRHATTNHQRTTTHHSTTTTHHYYATNHQPLATNHYYYYTTPTTTHPPLTPPHNATTHQPPTNATNHHYYATDRSLIHQCSTATDAHPTPPPPQITNQSTTNYDQLLTQLTTNQPLRHQPPHATINVATNVILTHQRTNH